MEGVGQLEAGSASMATLAVCCRPDISAPHYVLHARLSERKKTNHRRVCSAGAGTLPSARSSTPRQELRGEPAVPESAAAEAAGARSRGHLRAPLFIGSRGRLGRSSGFLYAAPLALPAAAAERPATGLGRWQPTNSSTGRTKNSCATPALLCACGLCNSEYMCVSIRSRFFALTGKGNLKPVCELCHGRMARRLFLPLPEQHEVTLTLRRDVSGVYLEVAEPVPLPLQKAPPLRRPVGEGAGTPAGRTQARRPKGSRCNLTAGRTPLRARLRRPGLRMPAARPTPPGAAGPLAAKWTGSRASWRGPRTRSLFAVPWHE